MMRSNAMDVAVSVCIVTFTVIAKRTTTLLVYVTFRRKMFFSRNPIKSLKDERIN